MSTDAHGDPTITSAAAAVARWRVASETAPADLEQFLPPLEAPHRGQVLSELVVAELQARIRLGQPARAEEYLERFPELRDHTSCLPKLVATELQARRQVGETIDEAEYRRRFPNLVNRWAPPRPAAVEPPHTVHPDRLQPGDQWGDFRIVRLLGQGSYARVYLAHQLSLDRRVALKVSTNEKDGTADEARALARFDHPHIVPVFSEHLLSGRRAIVMRYVAGRTLADWLLHRGDSDCRRLHGSDLLDWLRGPRGSSSPHDDSYADTLADARLPTVVCCLMLDLARALQHAHERGVLHLDIKPSNVLLDQQGRALLMDFNVAAVPASPASAAYVGGTLGYMAPEQLARFAGAGAQLNARINARTDIFALGTLFFELLTGRSPWPVPRTVSAQAAASQMLALRLRETPPFDKIPGSPGLRSIVAKCLAPQAGDRYSSAAALAEDLRCWLANQPLQTATDPSLVERCHKWWRRHPRIVAASAAVLLFASLLVFRSGWSDYHRLQSWRQQLESVEKLHQTGDKRQAIEQFRQLRAELKVETALPAWCLLGAQKGIEARAAALARGIANQQSDFLAAQVDDRRVLAAEAGVDIASNPLRFYDLVIPQDWRQHHLLQSLSESRRASVYESVTEVLLVQWQTAKARHQPDGLTRKNFFQRLPEPHADLPLLRFLHLETQSRPLRDIPLTDLAKLPSGDFEHYLVGVLAMFRLDWELGSEQFRSSLEINSDRFWARFYLGLACSLDPQQEHRAEAIASYARCIGMRPDFALPHSKLGQLYAQTEEFELARVQLEQAVKLAPQHTPSRIQLGKVLRQLGQTEQALEQLRKAAEQQPRSPLVHRELAAIYRSLRQPMKVVEHLEVAADVAKDQTEIRAELARAYLYARRLEEGISEFCQALNAPTLRPRQYFFFIEALQQRNQHRAALDILNRIVEQRPRESGGYLLRAGIHRMLLDTPSARADLATAFRINPSSLVARQLRMRMNGAVARRLLSDRAEAD